MAYKTRVKCLVKLLLEFYANIGRAHLRRSMGHSQPGVETPEIALKKPPVKFRLASCSGFTISAKPDLLISIVHRG
jgi:hypothetical protein